MDKKITELNSVSLPLSGAEEIPIVQNGETKKVSASDIGGNTKRTINVSLPFFRIAGQNDGLFYWQKSFGVYADFTLSTGKSDKNTLVGNSTKALINVPFNCKISYIFYNAGGGVGNELVIGKVNASNSNYANCYEKSFNSSFFDDNPTMIINFTKGDFLIPYFKINTGAVPYSQLTLILEEI